MKRIAFYFDVVDNKNQSIEEILDEIMSLVNMDEIPNHLTANVTMDREILDIEG